MIDTLYQRSEEEEKNISKKFYAEYTQARLHLFEHLKRKKPGSALVLSVAKGNVSAEIPSREGLGVSSQASSLVSGNSVVLFSSLG